MIEEVLIGTQTWMKENLSSTKFLNGDSITQCKSKKDWIEAYKNKIPAYRSLSNKFDRSKYGILYNYFAIIDPRKILPDPWIIPTKEDWKTLSDYSGGDYSAGPNLKTTEEWASLGSINGNGKNSFGFEALPAGYVDDEGNLYFQGENAEFWSSSMNPNNTLEVITRQLFFTVENFREGSRPTSYGFSIRGLKKVT